MGEQARGGQLSADDRTVSWLWSCLARIPKKTQFDWFDFVFDQPVHHPVLKRSENNGVLHGAEND